MPNDKSTGNPLRISLLSRLGGPFLVYIVREFEAHGVPIDSVIIDSKGESPTELAFHWERTQGRIRALPLHEFEHLDLPCYFVENHNDRATVELVRRRRIDLLVNAGTPRILKSDILDAPNVGVINVHPSLLPQFRGCTAIEWAIYLDERIGNTVHFMNERIDQGPIILKEALEFEKDDTYVDIRVKAHEHGFDLLARGVRRVIDEGLTPDSMEPQEKGRYFKVIEPDKLEAAMDKVRRGEYVYQR